MDLGVAPGARLLAGHRERIFANAPFRADNRVRSRARLRAVLDAEYGRVRMWRNERRINGRPSDARGLPGSSPPSTNTEPAGRPQVNLLKTEKKRGRQRSGCRYVRAMSSGP